MLRGMVFVDHQNFNIALQTYYRNQGLPCPKLDYEVLFKKITELVDNVDYVKASMYIPKPDAFLMEDAALANSYHWATNLSTKPFLDVIEGRFISRPTKTKREMDITDKSTYYKVEKGTDINLAADVISKAFHNSYDVAFILSADTDYLKIYDILRNLGKLTVVVVIKDQNVQKIRPHVDAVLRLDKNFFDKCLMPSTDGTDTEESTVATAEELGETSELTGDDEETSGTASDTKTE